MTRAGNGRTLVNASRRLLAHRLRGVYRVLLFDERITWMPGGHGAGRGGGPQARCRMPDPRRPMPATSTLELR